MVFLEFTQTFSLKYVRETFAIFLINIKIFSTLYRYFHPVKTVLALSHHPIFFPSDLNKYLLLFSKYFRAAIMIWGRRIPVHIKMSVRCEVRCDDDNVTLTYCQDDSSNCLHLVFVATLYWNDWVVNNTDTVTIGLVNIIVVLCYYYNGLPGYFLTLKYAALHSERCSFEKWGCCWVSIESFPVTLSLIWIKSEWT